MGSNKYIFIVQVTRQLSIDIINNFVDNGAEVELITGIVEPNYADLNSKVKVKCFLKYDNSSSIKRLLTWSVFTFLSFFYVLFKSRKKELIVITTPPFIVFVALLLKKIRNQKYHLIIWDLYPDVLVNFNVLSNESFAIRIWKKLNKNAFNNSENIFTLGKHLAVAIEKYTSKQAIVIQNWTNTGFIKPINRDENLFLKKHNLLDSFVVMYSGNLGLTHNIEAIVDAAEILQSNSKIKFVIIGEGAKKEKIEKSVREKQLQNVLLLSYQEKEMLPYSLTAADIGVVTLSRGAESISVPSKTYYTLAAGAAVLALAEKESELSLLIKKYDCGVSINNADAPMVGEFINEMFINANELNKYKQNARKASFDFSPQNAKLYYDYICNKKS